MPLLLLLAPQRRPDPDWIQLVFLAVFFLFPLIARIVRGVLGRATPGTRPGTAPLDPTEKARRQARRRAQREARRTEVEDGEDLWRRLLRGEDLARPAQPSAEERPAPVPEPVARAPVAAPPAPTEVPLTRRPVSAPLAMLGEVNEPGEVQALSLESEAEPEALGTLGLVPTEVEPELVAARWLDRRGLRRAMIVSEILAPPVSLRRS